MHDIDLKRWSPELRRAVMKVRPEFFSWPQERRERYSVSIPDEDNDRLDQALLQELFGQSYRTPGEASQAAADLPLELLDRWNETRQPLIGIGEDSFFLNDHLPDARTILDYPTLRALDEADHAAQEAFRRDEDAGYAGKPYRGSLYLGWARMYVDDRFAYASLSMAAGYILSELEGYAVEAVKACIPYRQVPGRDHGKWEGDSWCWDMRKDAGGQEALLDELERRTFGHMLARFDALSEEWHRLGRCGVYILDKSDSADPLDLDHHFVFTDMKSLDAVRFRSFVRDCRAIERPAAEIVAVAGVEKERLAAWIGEQHRSLLKSFDPKVAPLRKRLRIRIHKDALKDLE